MQTSLGLQVGTEQAALSQDAASPRNGRFLWIGSGFAVFMLIGISAHELMPLASHASAKPSHLVTEVAFKPLLPARSPGIRQIDPARPKGFSAAVLPLMQRPPGLRSAANGALHPPLRGAALRTSVSDADKPGEDGKEDDDKADDDTADEMDGAALMAQFNARIDQEGGATQFKAKNGSQQSPRFDQYCSGGREHPSIRVPRRPCCPGVCCAVESDYRRPEFGPKH